MSVVHTAGDQAPDLVTPLAEVIPSGWFVHGRNSAHFKNGLTE